MLDAIHRLASTAMMRQRPAISAGKSAANYLPLARSGKSLTRFSIIAQLPVDWLHSMWFQLLQLNADNAAVYDTVIFAGPPPMKQRLWPRHCVQDTWGSELHKDLKVIYEFDLAWLSFDATQRRWNAAWPSDLSVLRLIPLEITIGIVHDAIPLALIRTKSNPTTAGLIGASNAF
jgi:hypothetical protein